MGGAGLDRFVFGTGFGRDTVSGFDSTPSRGQDLLDISGLGVTAATFASKVFSTQVGADTVVSVGGGAVFLTDVQAATVGQSDFIFA